MRILAVIVLNYYDNVKSINENKMFSLTIRLFEFYAVTQF